MESEQLVDCYLDQLRSTPHATDEELFKGLVAAGATLLVATRVTQLVPSAFCRTVMGRRGVGFGAGYRILDGQSRVVARGDLNELPVFLAAKAQAERASVEFATAVAGRSAEFSALEAALRDGATLAAISIDELTLVDASAITVQPARDRQPEQRRIVYCEVCKLPHRPGAGLCEACGHLLGRTPNWPAIEGSRTREGRHALAALVTLVAMLAFNIWVFGGTGYVISVVPLFWLARSASKYRVLSKYLKAASPQSN